MVEDYFLASVRRGRCGDSAYSILYCTPKDCQTGDWIVLAVGELEQVPELTVTSPVQCYLIIPDHERRALFLLLDLSSTQRS